MLPSGWAGGGGRARSFSKPCQLGRRCIDAGIVQFPAWCVMCNRMATISRGPLASARPPVCPARGIIVSYLRVLGYVKDT